MEGRKYEAMSSACAGDFAPPIPPEILTAMSKSKAYLKPECIKGNFCRPPYVGKECMECQYYQEKIEPLEPYRIHKLPFKSSLALLHEIRETLL